MRFGFHGVECSIKVDCARDPYLNTAAAEVIIISLDVAIGAAAACLISESGTEAGEVELGTHQKDIYQA